MQTKKKHVAIKYHYLRELVQDKEVRMEYVNTKEKLVDIFTRALPEEPHEYLRIKLGVLPLSKATYKSKSALHQLSYITHSILDAMDIVLGSA